MVDTKKRVVITLNKLLLNRINKVKKETKQRINISAICERYLIKELKSRFSNYYFEDFEK